MPPNPNVQVNLRKKAKPGEAKAYQRWCGCLCPGAGKFKRFDDEPSAEFRQRMERAQTSLNLNERVKEKSAFDSGLRRESIELAQTSTREMPTTPSILAAAASSSRMSTPCSATPLARPAVVAAAMVPPTPGTEHHA